MPLATAARTAGTSRQAATNVSPSTPSKANQGHGGVSVGSLAGSDFTSTSISAAALAEIRVIPFSSAITSGRAVISMSQAKAPTAPTSTAAQ
jgi:hypothetical protein